jgi:glutaminyl-peptide cyclotransferase
MLTMKKIIPVLVLVGLLSCKNHDANPPDKPNPNAPANMAYNIVATFPHDTSSYTQGLIIYNGVMYEGTGNYGFSKLKKVDWKTGKTEKEISLDPKYFGEGVTILRDTIYQLTWKQKKVFVYTLNDFRKVKEFDADIEGWGLTNDGKNLIVSTGASDLMYYDPTTFTLLKTQTVTESGDPSFNLNELEYIDGYVYANQYQYPYIFKIDPATGKVVAKADVTAIWDKVKQVDPDVDVPNGIAYDSTTKKIYITGKWWPELYEVQFAK